MKLAVPFLVSLLSVLPSTIAHGFLGQVAIDGNWYAGNVPGSSKGGCHVSYMLLHPSYVGFKLVRVLYDRFRTLVLLKDPPIPT